MFGLDSVRQEYAIKGSLGYLGENALLPPDADANWLESLLSVCFSTWDSRLFSTLLKRSAVSPDKAARHLSKGTRTKLGLATALAHRPRLLVLDEPTSGLDPLVRQEVVETLREVARDNGAAVLFSTHIVSDLEA